MAECPRCDLEIGLSTSCSCGWRSRARSPFAQPKEPTVDCAHQGCNAPAMCKVKTATGWANLCTQHYDHHYRDEALATLDKYGLAKLTDETPAEHVLRMRQFVRNGFKTIGAIPEQPKQTEDDKKRAIAALMDDWSSDLGTQA